MRIDTLRSFLLPLTCSGAPASSATASRAASRRARWQGVRRWLVAFALASSPAFAQCQPEWWSGPEFVFFSFPQTRITEVVTMPNADMVVAGNFGSAGGVPVAYVARWDGRQWSALGSGLGGPVGAMHVMANGNLVVSGGGSIHSVLTWDGSAWSLTGGVAPSPSAVVHHLAELPNGNLVAAGSFNSINGVTANNIACWDGVSWTPMGLIGTPHALDVLPNGNPIVVASVGILHSELKSWDGTSWTTLATIYGLPRDLQVMPNGDIAVSGLLGLTYNGSNSSSYTDGVAIWNGSAWSTPCSSIPIPSSASSVYSMALCANGDLAVAGDFLSAGTWIRGGAIWNGSAWSFLGTRPQGPGIVNPTNYLVRALPGGALVFQWGSSDFNLPTSIEFYGCPAAQNEYGTGCYTYANSFHEQFDLGQFDLGAPSPAVWSLRMTPNSGGYSVAAGSGLWHTPTTPGLGLGDDAVATLPLPVAFTFPTGSTNALTICSNGFITLNGTSTNSDYWPRVSELLASEPRLCPAWCDLTPDASHDVYAEVVGNVAYVTWDGVPTYNPGGSFTMQVAIDLAVMTVEYRYQDCSNPASEALTGWSPGNLAVDPGTRDLSSGTPFQTSPLEIPGLAHSGVNRPRIGYPVVLNTTNVPASSPLGATLIGFGQHVPGLDLTNSGMPGCFQYASADSVSMFLPTAGGGSHSFQLPLWPVLIGVHLYSQAVAFVPGVNPLGAISSNGVDLSIGN